MTAEVVLGTAVGFMVGVALTAVLCRMHTRPTIYVDNEVHRLSPTDRKAVSAELGAHTASVRRELSRYADELADGDDRLREQLRRFEAGV